MATASIAGSSKIVSMRSHWGNGNFSANLARRSALGLNAYATSTQSTRSMALLACGTTAMPRPTIAMRVFFIGKFRSRIADARRMSLQKSPPAPLFQRGEPQSVREGHLSLAKGEPLSACEDHLALAKREPLSVHEDH